MSASIQMSHSLDRVGCGVQTRAEVGMESSGCTQSSSEGPVGGRLRELVSSWFTETQAAGLTRDGHFPVWFQGFVTRKEAEEQLKGKAVGVFLVRLSEKAFGYVLSYKGVECCRHFVIVPKEDHFCIAGDELQHNSLSELIHHYKVRPILPFGEFLTSSSSSRQEHEVQEKATDVYDVVSVNPKGKTGVSVQALRSLWDQKGALITEITTQTKSQLLNNINTGKEQVPVLPAKSNRRLTGSMSVDTSAFSKCTANEVTSLSFLSTASSPDHHLQNGPLTPNLTPRDEPQNSLATAPLPVSYSSHIQLGNRSQSLPCLDHNEEFSVPIYPPKTPTYSLLDEALLRSNPLYEPAADLQGGNLYAEVADVAKEVDPTYEDIAKREKGSQRNHYESVEKLKTKKEKGKNKEWKNFFTDYLRK